MSENKSIINPTVIKESARLKIKGKILSNNAIKSTTSPLKIRSNRFPKAPPRIKDSEILTRLLFLLDVL